MLVDTFSAVVLSITMLFPPSSPLVIALGLIEGGVAVAYGILQISQRDTAEGVFEATVGAIGVGSIGASAYAIKGTKGINSYSDFSKKLSKIGKRKDLSDAQKLQKNTGIISKIKLQNRYKYAKRY